MIDNNKYIISNNCSMISKMNKKDFLKLVSLLDEIDLNLRESLNLDDNITFGLELEFEHSNNKIIKNYLNQFYPGWTLKHDASLVLGGEINSPILCDFNWQEVDDICSFVSKYAVIAKRSGGHIHFGSQILGNNIESWGKFLKLWAAYENVIFRFCYGNYLNARSTINLYAKPIAYEIKNILNNYYFQKEDNINLIKTYLKKRYQAVNFSNVNGYNFEKNNTIEFRCPNATLESVTWQNNVNFLAKLMLCCKSNKYDLDLIEKRLEEVDKITCNLIYYKEIFVEQSIELCDMIFDNNLDKLYFLKQYLKSFEIGKYACDSKVKIKKL